MIEGKSQRRQTISKAGDLRFVLEGRYHGRASLDRGFLGGALTA